MSERRGFVCAGCWTVDRIKIIDTWPAQEELANILATDQQGGGSAHNCGIDLRILDNAMPVEAVGLIGDDPDGEFLLEQARTHGMDVQQLQQTREAKTSFTDVMSVSDTGKRTFFHHPGSNDLFTPDHIHFKQTSARVLHLGLLGVHKALDNAWQEDSNGWVAILKRAKQHDLQTNIEMVSISPDRNRQLGLPCLPWLDTLIVNDHEIGSLANLATIDNGVTNKQQCLLAARRVLEMGAMWLVVVHYPGGAICITRDGQLVESDSLPVAAASIVSTVGAGDAFAAGMLYALHEHWPLDQCLFAAHAVAASSLRSATTVGSVEDIDTCLRLARGAGSPFVG